MVDPESPQEPGGCQTFLVGAIVNIICLAITLLPLGLYLVFIDNTFTDQQSDKSVMITTIILFIITDIFNIYLMILGGAYERGCGDFFLTLFVAPFRLMQPYYTGRGLFVFLGHIKK